MLDKTKEVREVVIVYNGEMAGAGLIDAARNANGGRMPAMALCGSKVGEVYSYPCYFEWTRADDFVKSIKGVEGVVSAEIHAVEYPLTFPCSDAAIK